MQTQSNISSYTDRKLCRKHQYKINISYLSKYTMIIVKYIMHDSELHEVEFALYNVQEYEE